DDIAVLQHDVMCRHLACGIAKMVDRILIVRHPGIVQHDHIGCAAAPALVVIGRRPNLRDDGGFRRQLRFSHRLTAWVLSGAAFQSKAKPNGWPARTCDCAETMRRDKLAYQGIDDMRAATANARPGRLVADPAVHWGLSRPTLRTLRTLQDTTLPNANIFFRC